jgi:hypothetical protein
MLAERTKSNGMWEWESCVWTSGALLGVLPIMGDDTDDIIIQLCTRIGMIMEDASVAALTVAGIDRERRVAALVELDAAAKRIGALVEAAKVLLI